MTISGNQLSVKKSQRGSLFTILFGAVALIGVLAAGVNVVMRGPMATMSEVTHRTVAENNMLTATRLAIVMAATNQPNNGDCDADGFVEPFPFRDATTMPKPTGGGYIPTAIGATTIDPWNTEYGYCVWDHGPKTTTDNIVGCGGASAKRLKGANSEKHVAIAIISAGKDRVFQTTCNAFVDANADGIPDTPLVDKPGSSDDIVVTHSYAEANSVGNGLWFLKSDDPHTAEVGERDIEITGSTGTGAASIGYDPAIGASGVGNFMAVKADDIYPKTANSSIEFLGTMRAPSITGLEAPEGMNIAAGSCTLDGITKSNGESHTFYSASTHANCASISLSRTCDKGTFSGSVTFDKASCGGPPGQVAYTTPGTYNWTAPAGVTSVSVVAVGGGGNAGSANQGGGGGGLGYKNNIPVISGNTYTVMVGTTAGDSYFINISTVRGGGGSNSGTGGTFTGDGGGNGGDSVGTAIKGGGGGGAGGYSGKGGNGGIGGAQWNAGQNGSGGGGGGGAGADWEGGAGGGVGIFGEGPSGLGATSGNLPGSSGYGYSGQGGSGGTPTTNTVIAVGTYGGGDGGGNGVGNATGAVRIIWPGSARSFPSTRTADE